MTATFPVTVQKPGWRSEGTVSLRFFEGEVDGWDHTLPDLSRDDELRLLDMFEDASPHNLRDYVGTHEPGDIVVVVGKPSISPGV